MIRALLTAFVIALGFAGCGPKPEPPAPAPAAEQGDPMRPVQNGEKPEITAGKISKDVVGKVVDVPELSGTGPSDKWTFEASEYRHIDILEKRATTSGMELLVF